MTHVAAPAFKYSSGPRDAKLAFVAECWGEQEDMVGRPLIGNAGQEFTRLCQEAGINRNECFLTNTICARPPDNKFDEFCCKKDETGEGYSLPPLAQGKYLKPEFLGELDRLKEELCTVSPNLVVALGAKALWALTQTSAIGSMRGTVAFSKMLPKQKVLATYHPSYLFKVWSYRPIVLADLMKAKHEATFPEVRRPEREVLVFPTLEEIEEWFLRWQHTPILSIDIETSRGQITDIGFSPRRDRSLVITFVQRDGTDFWPTLERECAAWKWVQALCALPCRKLFQNGVFDLSYLMKQGIKVRNCADDTMLLHHSMYPELQKGLGFLGSIYTQEPAWKLMARHKEEFKKDE
jgi:uracil-DNA glycosylase